MAYLRHTNILFYYNNVNYALTPQIQRNNKTIKKIKLDTKKRETKNFMLSKPQIALKNKKDNITQIQ